MAAPKICVIGSGPSGMSVLFQLERLRLQGGDKVLPEITCYEKQRDWGGLWNYDWRTGLDEFGESVHGSMYQNLWSNSPKEVQEFPDYTFKDHFGKEIPSFIPREVMLHYLCGRWNTYNLKEKISFLHSVHRVTFDADRDKFLISVKDLKNDKLIENQEFDYLINCSGHFSTPHVPYFKGIEQFPGRVLHSHDLRSWAEFIGQRMLVVGGSYSAEDAALQLMKHGASSVTCSTRTKPMGFKWPETITERPHLVEIEGKVAKFKDGSSAEVDGIILATGYQHHYPYLPDNLRLVGKNALYHDNLYKCTQWLGGGNLRMFYIGAQDQCYSLTMFDSQALWALKRICGDIKLPSVDDMQADVKKWMERLTSSVKDPLSGVDFQTDFLVDIAKEAGYAGNLDAAKWFYEWAKYKEENILTFRDRSFPSRVAGADPSPVGAVPFMSAMDTSVEAVLGGLKL